MAKLVYSFGDGRADGSARMKDLLGGKGANLAEMTTLGIPVPPGFTISTRACRRYFEDRHRLPDELAGQVERALRRLERARGKRFGDEADPLLVSVRSGAKFSMPGMMDTILNLGLNDRTVRGLADSSGDRRFAFDSYRRFVQMYADVVLGLPKERFEEKLSALKRRRGVEEDTALGAEDLEGLVRTYKKVVREGTDTPFPDGPLDQLWGAVTAVFRSWDNARARLYRRRYGIPDDLGTAVNVQTMVFGNLGEDCATGVAFTRDPATGENVFYGEYLSNAQGEDVVAGVRTPHPIRESRATGGQVSLETLMPKAYRELLAIRKRLERHYRDMQDLEFTIERGRLYMLQTRTGKRTGVAALNVAFDMHRERKIDRREVVRRIEPEQLEQLLAPEFAARELKRAADDGRVIARGLPAGPGAACGRLAFDATEAAALAAEGHAVVLVRTETSPEDLGGMVAAAGILTARGGMTSHAAVVARGMGKPCVVGAEELRIDERSGRLRAGGRTLERGDALAIDGTTGQVIAGAMEAHPSEIQRGLRGRTGKKKSRTFERFVQLMTWADSFRSLGVRTNADTPEDCKVARALGAEGIGLCRTEHMFFGEDRIAAVREMILAEDAVARARALRKLLPMQRRDFRGIFKAMDGLPVTIRLLDPPLHEFLPNEPGQIAALASSLGVSRAQVEERVEALREVNPMLGHRGCRLGITFPEIYEMQARAIFEAAAAASAAGVTVLPEVMVPLVGTAEELRLLRERIVAVAESVAQKKGGRKKLHYRVGTMIEIPRACLVAADVAAHAEFFSFGTNDLTQLTYGYSRDDAGKFLPEYVERRILDGDPFAALDSGGVGRLMEMAVREGRGAREGLKIGVCGEHGGDPSSIRFFHGLGVDYVSCSPYRVPVARLAAARVALDDAEPGTS